MTKHFITGAALYSWQQQAKQLAQKNNIDKNEVDWLLQEFTPLSNLSLKLGDYREQQAVPSKISIATLTEKWHQRLHQRVPVQYLAGKTPWRNFSLTVTPDVLIPRPETELIIDIAHRLVEQHPNKEQLLKGHWADMGTGSGAIAIALAKQFPEATIHAVDLSKKALAVAQQNAIDNGLNASIRFHQGSWFNPLAHMEHGLSAVISNPPYIPTQAVHTLQPEITRHEPHLALDGGKDGLSSIKTIVDQGLSYLKPGGIWLIEIMSGQAKAVADILANQVEYTHIRIHRDLSGIQRFVSARKVL